MTRLAPALATLRQHAETVGCPRCGVPARTTCCNERTGHPLTIQAAHKERVALADHRAALTAECSCGAQAGQPCRDHDGHPLPQRHPDHEARLRAAGVWRDPLDPHDLQGWPSRRNRDTALALGRQELERSRSRQQLQMRRQELEADRRAGDLTATDHAELVELDAVLGIPAQPDQPPDQHETDPDQPWRRGPRGTG